MSMRKANRSIEILKHIAEHGPRIEYHLYKELEYSHGTIHYVLNKLNDAGLLRVAPNGKGQTGRPVKEFHLTVYGFIKVIKYPKGLEHIDEFAEKWGHLIPLVLGKWKYFKKMGLCKIAEERLKEAVRNIVIDIHPDEKFLQECVTLNFHHIFFYPRALDGLEEWKVWNSRLKWFDVCMKDKDLKPYIIHQLKQLLYAIQDEIMREKEREYFISEYLKKHNIEIPSK